MIPKIQIGNHVLIEKDCVVSALSIGSYVHVGEGSIIVWTHCHCMMV